MKKCKISSLGESVRLIVALKTTNKYLFIEPYVICQYLISKLFLDHNITIGAAVEKSVTLLTSMPEVQGSITGIDMESVTFKNPKFDSNHSH